MLSDGAKRIFITLSNISICEILNIPLIILEEPENEIHPGLLRTYLDCLMQFCEKSKLVLISHSPVLVNNMNLSTLYFGMPTNDGTAQFKKIKPALIKKVYGNADTLGVGVGDYMFDLMSSSDDFDVQTFSNLFHNDI